MEITWYGHSCFRLAERNKATVVTDPFNASIGYEAPRLKADVVTISHDAPGHNNYEAVRGYSKIFVNPGEYEMGGVFITGAPLINMQPDSGELKRNIAFVFNYEGLTIAHLGDLDHVPAQPTIESLGSVNIALVPVGGGGGLNATQAAEVISMLEPSYVIPMHYKTDVVKLDLEPVDRFLKEMGVSRIQQEEVFKVTASSLPEQTHIILLNQSR